MDDKEQNRKTPEAMVVSSYPDVCKSPVTPVPYTIVSNFQTSQSLATSVNATKLPTFTRVSFIQGVQGDEGGTGKGVVSGTYSTGGISTPVEWSPTVLAEKQQVIRHDDRFMMNTGNTEGKAVFPDKDSAPKGGVGKDGKPKQDTNPKKGLLKRTWDNAQELTNKGIEQAKGAYNYMDQNYQLGTRAEGLWNAVSGYGEATVGTGMMAVPGLQGPGLAFALHGSDKLGTGLIQAGTGVKTPTLTEQYLGKNVDDAMNMGAALQTGKQITAKVVGYAKEVRNGTRVSTIIKREATEKYNAVKRLLFGKSEKGGDMAPRRQFDDTD